MYVKVAPIAIAAILMIPMSPVAQAQNATASPAAPADAKLMSTGQELYTTDCVACHQANGTGNPPTFPALAGNAKLGNLEHIVTNIHSGKGNMPAFPDLGASDIAALATFIRNSWGNSFGGVSESDVTPLLASGAGSEKATPAASRSIWDGVYTEAQAERGAPVVSGTCAKCHGRALNGAGEPDQPPSPGIARVGFLQRWDGRTLEALFQYTKSTMPKDNPGQLTDQQYADAIAVMLSVSKVPAGTTELPSVPAELGGIVIKPKAD
jgi:mono/diheme cytochrome c family protein